MYPNCTLVVCGDFNRKNAQLLENHFCLKQVFKFPLEKTLTLDLFLTNLKAHYEDEVAFPPFSLSDHSTVLPSLKITENNLKTNKFVLRGDLRASGKAKLGYYLGSMYWSVLFSSLKNYEEQINVLQEMIIISLIITA